LGNVEFPIAQTVDEDGNSLMDPTGSGRFVEGRNGDHLMVPFQCELCHFRNIYGREPQANNVKDKLFFKYARRANLDCFWSREPPTVRNNLSLLNRITKTEDKFGFSSVAPPMGPFPVADVLGMKAAIAILDRSMDKGVYAPRVQWGTFRKTMSAVTNVSQAGVSGLGDSVGAYQRNKMWISTSVSHQFWFSRFMEGIHKRVGEVRRQDEAFTIEIILQVNVNLEREWNKLIEGNASKRELKVVAEMGTWFVVGFCTGMRGEEIPLIELAGTRNSLDNKMGKEPYFNVVISGRTKGNQVSGSKFKFPCVYITSGSGLNPGTWIRRLVNIRNEEKDESGRLFHRGISPSKVSQFEIDFFKQLYQVQATTDLIDNKIDVGEIYGMLRSSRRGATAHARNIGVQRDVIEAVHRWHQEAYSGGMSLRLDLIDVYTTLDALAPTILGYSRAF